MRRRLRWEGSMEKVSFWVWSGTEMEWCIVKVMTIMMIMFLVMNCCEKDEMTVRGTGWRSSLGSSFQRQGETGSEMSLPLHVPWLTCVVSNWLKRMDWFTEFLWRQCLRLLQTVCVHLCLSMHRRSQGLHWVHVHPPGRIKTIGPNLQGKVVSAPPERECTPRESKSSICFEEIGEMWKVGEVI